MRVVTGFHAIEEELRSLEEKAKGSGRAALEGISIRHDKPGPRVKKILAEAARIGVPATAASDAELDRLAAALPEQARDHRGIVMLMAREEAVAPLRLDEAVRALAGRETALVVILDSITDPHNVGAVIRSADQFGVDLVVLPERRGATDFGVIGRTSAGASAWVPCALTANLVRAAELLKEAGFWIYAADAGGKPAHETTLAGKVALVMGSEGDGVSRLLKERCDGVISIPTRGRLDSLNVSVAAGILLYETRRQGASSVD